MALFKLGEKHISQTTFHLNGSAAFIDTYHCQFARYLKPVTFDTYGGKAILEWRDEPLFAELYALRMLESQGYAGVWADTYRSKFWNGPPSVTPPVTVLPAMLNKTYEMIKRHNGSKSRGCWDLLAVKDDTLLFAELKRSKKDKIQPSQVDWLQAALNCGLSTSNFIIIEWDYS